MGITWSKDFVVSHTPAILTYYSQALQTLADREITAFHEHFPQLFNSLLPYLVSPCSTPLRLKAAITCHNLWVALVKARLSVATTLVERKALSRSMVDRITSFLEKSPSEWAPESALSIGATQCSISAASAMFSALVHEAVGEKMSPTFPMDLLDRVVQTNVGPSTPEAKKLWRDFIVGIVRVGSGNSTFFEFLRNRVLAENSARRTPPQPDAVRKAIWGSVWDCAVFLVTQTPLAELSVKWEDIVSLTQCIPFSDADPNVEWSIIEARWNTIIHAAVERCDLINVSRACVIEKVVPCISHQRIGYVLLFALPFGAYAFPGYVGR
jgi:hypothetical protein